MQGAKEGQGQRPERQISAVWDDIKCQGGDGANTARRALFGSDKDIYAYKEETIPTKAQ